MKTRVFFAVFAWLFLLVFVPLLPAQEVAPALTPAQMAQLDTPVKDWQLNLNTLAIAWFVLRRAFHNIRNGGGLRGLWSALLFGDKTPAKEEP